MDSKPEDEKAEEIPETGGAKEGNEGDDAEDVSKMDENVFKQNTDIIETTAEQEF